MTVFIACVADRHTDPEVRPFTEQDAAVAWARENFRQRVAHPEMIREEPLEGYVLWIRYLPEYDNAWVIARQMDDASPL
jgi:hypothetical protein